MRALALLLLVPGLVLAQGMSVPQGSGTSTGSNTGDDAIGTPADGLALSSHVLTLDPKVFNALVVDAGTVTCAGTTTTANAAVTTTANVAYMDAGTATFATGIYSKGVGSGGAGATQFCFSGSLYCAYLNGTNLLSFEPNLQVGYDLTNPLLLKGSAAGLPNTIGVNGTAGIQLQPSAAKVVSIADGGGFTLGSDSASNAAGASLGYHTVGSAALATPGTIGCTQAYVDGGPGLTQTSSRCYGAWAQGVTRNTGSFIGGVTVDSTGAPQVDVCCLPATCTATAKNVIVDCWNSGP